MLDLIPAEILAIIVKQIEYRLDVKRLCEVSRGVYSVAAPVLYESIIVSADEDDLARPITTIERLPHSLLAYTKHISFVASASATNGPSCVHRWVQERVPTKDPCEDGHAELLNRLDSLLRLLFSHLRKQSLRSFSWELGYIPNCLLEGEDCPFKSQPQLDALSLITDPTCPQQKPGTLNLHQFSDLRSLSWEGVGRYEVFESIRAHIKTNGPNLRSLKLDLIAWPEAKSMYNKGFFQRNPNTTPPEDFFASCVLEIDPGTSKVILPRLRELTLSEMSFRTSGRAMIHAFNVENLESLALRNCSWTSSWFAAIIEQTTTLQLKRFELRFSPYLGELGDPMQWHLPRHLPLFLQHFEGLEDLYLLLYEPLGLKSLAAAILHHARTLRRLIVHCTVEGVVAFFNYGRLDEAALPGLLQKLSLECVGLCISAPNLRGVLAQCPARPGWKLLHLRGGGTSRQVDESVARQAYKCNSEIIYKFARWAFGTEGLPELQVLVYGDFSHSTWRSKYNLMLCRSSEGYHALTREDEGAWRLVRMNMDMLSACPRGSAKA